CEYKKTSSSDGGLVFDLTAAKGGYYYAVFTQKVRSGCSLQVNGSPVGEYFASDFSGVANLGRYKPGDSISTKLSSSGTSGVAIESEFIYCLDEVEFLRAIEELRARAADNLSVVGSTITASADSEGGNEILWLCVPFEDSWSALVNGSKTEIIEYDNTFIGIPLERGYNEIKLHYSPVGVAVGIAISLASALCLCTFVCIEHKSHKNKTI
ncbi:MAG: YfhO family protein, partial [Oscillospiraceae bacterium]